jgi:hypothetical protein
LYHRDPNLQTLKIKAEAFMGEFISYEKRGTDFAKQPAQCRRNPVARTQQGISQKKGTEPEGNLPNSVPFGIRTH